MTTVTNSVTSAVPSSLLTALLSRFNTSIESVAIDALQSELLSILENQLRECSDLSDMVQHFNYWFNAFDEALTILELDDDALTDEDRESLEDMTCGIPVSSITGLEDWEYIEEHHEEAIHENQIDDYLDDTALCSLPELPCWLSIDWENTRRNLRMDYSCFSVFGATYYYYN